MRRRPNTRKPRICKQCGGFFLPRGGVAASSPRRFCSRKCYAAWQSRTMRVSAGERRRREIAARRERKIYLTRECAECGRTFTAAHGNQKICSDSCRRRRGNRNVCNKRYPKKVQACKECGGHFTSPFKDKHRIFCSDRCGRRYWRRISKAIRRARKRGVGFETFDTRDVFERDGWRCRACGRKTPKCLLGKMDKRAPVLDHIVALADGGAHTRRNSQCLCRECNSLKGSRTVGQLRLFG